MKYYALVVEGQTEEAFVTQILNPYLSRHGQVRWGGVRG